MVSKKIGRAAPQAAPHKPLTLHHRQAPEFVMLTKLVGDRVRLWRESHAWTLAQAAERIEVQAPFMSRLERGMGNPTLAVLISIAKAMEMTVPELLTPE